MAEELGNTPPPRVTLASGLATHPGNIEEFRETLSAMRVCMQQKRRHSRSPLRSLASTTYV
jgi:hypothetical protein